MPENKARIIEIVKTPMSFFVLIVLLVEGVLGNLAIKCPDQSSMIINGMLSLFFSLIAIVAFFAYFRPEALTGDPELKNLREKFQEVEKIAEMISGKWGILSFYRKSESGNLIESKATCEITKGRYGITMNGKAIDTNGGLGISFDVKQAFITEDGLTFIFKVKRTIDQQILGLGQVAFVLPVNGDKLIKTMSGNWGVLGSEVSGRIEFSRQN